MLNDAFFLSIVHLFHFSINRSMVITEAFNAANISFSLFPSNNPNLLDHNMLNNPTYFKFEETEALEGIPWCLKTDNKTTEGVL